ncbi:glycosyltransferase family 2 protein [Candidatus Planktophila versatilis]|uniref:glycosyltransferase family 2 protein n=1 Tax=Candidatus Planktophila versatilis TaxID=1884905 RepID=UPI00167FE29B|nr:glycosyltransferase family 2 protein [Candidatus Planktophila versatilis]
MGNQLFSVVVPIIPKHFVYLPKLLKEFESEEESVGEIIICASSTIDTDLSRLQLIKSESNLSKLIRILSTDLYQTAGLNRNRGWESALFPVVSFIDADDTYHPKRLKILNEVLEATGADCVVHDYYRLTPRFRFKLSVNKFSRVSTSDEMRKANSGIKSDHDPADNLYRGETNLRLPSNVSKRSRIHHGHATVKTKILLRFSDRRFGEDGELLQKIVNSGLDLVYLDAKLSIYDRLNFSNLSQSARGHLSNYLRLIYRGIFLAKPSRKMPKK